MKRRDFHRLTATALFGHKAFGGLVQAFSFPWKLGIITDQVDMDLGNVLSGFFAKYHLGWAEIRYLKLDAGNRYVYANATAAQLRRVRRQLDDAGVKVSVLDTAIYKIVLPGTTPVGESPAYVNSVDTRFDRQMEELKRAADAAHALGTDRIRIFTFRRVADPNAVFDRVVEELQTAIRVAKQQAVTLLVENEYDCNTATGNEIAQLFKAIRDVRLMHNWDPCNCYEMDEQPFPKVWDQLDHSRISHIHLKDALGKEWKPIGAGEINFTGQFQALKSMRYSGTLSLETRYRGTQRDAYASSVESMNGLIRILKRL